MPLIIPSNTITGGYEIDNSLRFDDGSSDYLNRTPASASNRKTWTFSAWVKLGNIVNTYRCIFSANNSVNYNVNGTYLWFRTDHKLQISFGSGVYSIITNALFRDPSAWYHVVVAFDTTQGTSSNRVKMYVNGVEQTYSSSSYPTLNYEARVNDNSPHTVGSRRYISIDGYFDGYIAEAVLIDGQQLDPTSFGEFDEDSGIWKPIDVSGLTFGTNGFYLDFENSGSLGADVSGNSNNFTVNNLTSDDQMIDTPTNNWCTLNPLYNPNLQNATFSEGNLKAATVTNSGNFVGSGFLLSTGKWYAEMYVNDRQVTTNNFQIRNPATGSSVIYYRASGDKNIDGSLSSYGASWDDDDIIAMAFDIDAGTVNFYKNNVDQGTISYGSSLPEVIVGMSNASSSGGLTGTWNFGQDSSFAGLVTRQNNQDSNGQGDFYYSPPSGYLALNTKNLAEYG